MATKKSITNDTASTPSTTKTTRSKKTTTTPTIEATTVVKEEVKEIVAVAKNVKIDFTFATNNNETEKVAVLGDFNNWNLVEAVVLKKQKDGSFKGTVELEKGKAYQYRFFVNGTTWANDPTATNLVQSPFGSLNAVVEA